MARCLKSGEVVLCDVHELGHQTQVVTASRSQSLFQLIQTLAKHALGLLRSVHELNRLPNAEPWLLGRV